MIGPWEKDHILDNPADYRGIPLTINVGAAPHGNSLYIIPASGGSLISIVVGKLGITEGKIRVWFRDAAGNVLQEWDFPPDMHCLGRQLPWPLVNCSATAPYTLAFGGAEHPGLAIYTTNTVD